MSWRAVHTNPFNEVRPTEAHLKPLLPDSFVLVFSCENVNFCGKRHELVGIYKWRRNSLLYIYNLMGHQKDRCLET